MPSSCSRISAAPSSASRIRSPALSCATSSLIDVALGRGVLGVRADIEVQAGPVLQEDVRGPAPVHDPAEQVPGDLVGREAPLPAERAGDPVLVLEPEDPPVHTREPTAEPARSPGATPARDLTMPPRRTRHRSAGRPIRSRHRRRCSGEMQTGAPSGMRVTSTIDAGVRSRSVTTPNRPGPTPYRRLRLDPFQRSDAQAVEGLGVRGGVDTGCGEGIAEPGLRTPPLFPEPGPDHR